MLKALLTICILAATATAQVPTPTVVAHPYIKPTAKEPAVTQLAPLPLVDFDGATQPVNTIVKDGRQVTVPRWWPEKPTTKNLDKTFWALTAIWGAGVAADIYTTKKALARGAIESNPFYARNGGRDVAFGLNIAITTTTWGVAAWMQSMGWKWPARVLMGYWATTRWKAAIHNHGILRD